MEVWRWFGDALEVVWNATHLKAKNSYDRIRCFENLDDVKCLQHVLCSFSLDE